MRIDKYKNKEHRTTSINIQRFWILISFVFVLLFTTLQPVNAQTSSEPELSFKQMLLTPGKLNKVHAKFEAQCHKCHVQFDKNNQAPLCLDCHKAIKKDLTNRTGFHSSISKDTINQCNRCHTDHIGRKSHIVTLDKAQFDHSKTDFPLKGHHQTLECNDCHKDNEKNFRKKEFNCSSCHSDPHKGKLDNDCTSCHGQESWKKQTFDHDTTDFKLTGKHKKLNCSSCHIQDVSVEIGHQCINCHQAKDKHFTVFGTKCDSCHSTKTWKKNNYNHKKETKFALLGKHKKLACVDCHAKKLKLPTDCFSCHKKDDVHSGSNGKDCLQCHSNTSWKKTSFNHDKDTDFKLNGSHKTLNCVECHSLTKIKKSSKKTTVRNCFDCHQLDDPHQQQLGKHCEQCHQERDWSENVLFNHELTRFPLTGEHQLLVCQSCHDSKTYQIKSVNCYSCHQVDDIHDTVMGKKCETCHNSASWSAWQFNHDTQTKFELTGSHKNLTCELCHDKSSVQPLKPGKFCIDCHQQDDIHQGSFGRNCQRCHNTEKFYDFKH